MNIVKSIWYFLIPRERTLIFTSFDADTYAKVKYKLVSGDIAHRTRIISQGSGRGIQSGRRTSQYCIYVAETDEYAARQLM